MLSLTPMTRGRTGSSALVYLFKAISRAFAAYNLYEDVDISSFCHVYPDVFGQTNSTDCVIFAIKDMEMWNEATLVELIARVSPHTSLSTCIYNYAMSNFDIKLIVVCYICINRIKYPFTDCDLQ